jgi:uncharacterized membrane protein YeaQ/YmgE (transglycosylase-associated protein family)
MVEFNFQMLQELLSYLLPAIIGGVVALNFVIKRRQNRNKGDLTAIITYPNESQKPPTILKIDANKPEFDKDKKTYMVHPNAINRQMIFYDAENYVPLQTVSKDEKPKDIKIPPTIKKLVSKDFIPATDIYSFITKGMIGQLAKASQAAEGKFGKTELFYVIFGVIGGIGIGFIVGNYYPMNKIATTVTSIITTTSGAPTIPPP